MCAGLGTRVTQIPLTSEITQVHLQQDYTGGSMKVAETLNTKIRQVFLTKNADRDYETPIKQVCRYALNQITMIV